MIKEAFKRGFYKRSFVGKLLTVGSVGLDAVDVLGKVKKWGNRNLTKSMKKPSFYSYRRLPRHGNYSM